MKRFLVTDEDGLILRTGWASVPEQQAQTTELAFQLDGADGTQIDPATFQINITTGSFEPIDPEYEGDLPSGELLEVSAT